MMFYSPQVVDMTLHYCLAPVYSQQGKTVKKAGIFSEGVFCVGEKKII